MTETQAESAYEKLPVRHKKFVDDIVQGVPQYKAYHKHVHQGRKNPPYNQLSGNAARATH